MQEPVVIGFLAPDGYFTACHTYEHMRTALYLCNKLGHVEYDAYAAEQWLLSKGYVIFRSNDAYMNHYKDIAKALNGVDCTVNLLTQAQLAWINERDAQAAWNNSMQADSVFDLLVMDSHLRANT